MVDKVLLAFIIGIGLSLITVLGDALIKHASLQSEFAGWRWLLLGAVIYAMTAFGWFFVMRKAKLSTLGVLYSVSIVVFLTLVSVFYFKERISSMEIVGIALAIISLILLGRFA
jgi:drug/metabolite transporter (DMT)-like permease